MTHAYDSSRRKHHQRFQIELMGYCLLPVLVPLGETSAPNVRGTAYLLFWCGGIEPKSYSCPSNLRSVIPV